MYTSLQLYTNAECGIEAGRAFSSKKRMWKTLGNHNDRYYGTVCSV